MKLVDDHWYYVEGVLIMANMPEKERHIIKWFYKTAFEHGYGHGREDERKEITDRA